MKSYIPGIFAFVAGTVLFAANMPAKEHNAVLDAYLKVSQALAADDLPGAKSAATDLAAKAKTGGYEALASHASELAKSESIENARDHFKKASGEVVKLAEGKSGYYVMTCPMAKADWVQSNPKVSNPYLGKSMPNCGSIKEQKKTSSTGCIFCPVFPS